MTRAQLVPRLAGFGTTIFAEMSALAVATGSINLGQGFPDTDGPPEVAEAAIAAIRAGHNQYPPGPGIPELRAAIATHQQHWYGLAYDPDTEVLVTAGATEAIAATLLALCDRGDEVVVFEPYYDSYAACIAMAGGVRVPVTLRTPDYAFDPDALRRAITPRTRLLLLNSPHNPTGKVFTHEELALIADAVCRARPRRRHRRGVRAPHVRRRRARAPRDAAGHARPDDHDLLGGQDVLVHRLEDRLGVCPAGPARRGAHGQAVPHVRERRAVPARDRRRARVARRLVHRLRRRPRRPARPARRRAPGRRLPGLRRRVVPTSSPSTPRRSARPMASPSAGSCRHGAAWWPSRTRSSTTTPRRAGPSCASRSASSARSSRTLSPASVPSPERPLRRTCVADPR